MAIPFRIALLGVGRNKAHPGMGSGRSNNDYCLYVLISCALLTNERRISRTASLSDLPETDALFFRGTKSTTTILFDHRY
jgi:hypothetical protein